MGKLRGLLDSANETIGGLLGDFPAGFNRGTVAGFAGWPGDMAYMADMARRALSGDRSGPAAQDFPGTTDYIAAKAGYPIPQSFSGQLGSMLGGMLSPSPTDLAKIAPVAAMFLGARAKGANHALLNLAQDMEKAGATADDIWLATGAKGQPWFKGTDGKWKFWISDKGAEFHPGKVLSETTAQYNSALDEAYAASVMRHQMDRTPGMSIGEAKDWFRETFGKEVPEGAGQYLRNFDAETLLKRYMDLEARPTPTYSNISAPLSRFLDHPALYEADPELANIPVRGVTPGMLSPGTAGQASSSGIDILDEYLPRLETGKSLLLHEIQHPVQSRMGFAKGGNPEEFKTINLRDETVTNILNALDRHWKEFPAELRQEAMLVAQGKDIDGSAMRAIQSNPKAKSAYASYQAAKKDLEWATNPNTRFGTVSPWDQYMRQAGETEARNTQTLMNKGQEEYASFRPWLTQDVPTEQQIVRFGDGPAMSVERNGEPINPPGMLDAFVERRAGKAKPYKQSTGAQ